MKNKLAKFLIFSAMLFAAVTAIYAQKSAIEYYRLGSQKYAAQDYSGAVADFTECIRADPNANGCVGNRAMSFDQMKDHRAAIADFTTYIAMLPTSDFGYFHRGLAYHQLNEYKLALADYRAALKINPDGAQTKKLIDSLEPVVKKLEVSAAATEYFNQGKTRFTAGDVAGAAEAYTKCIELDPSSDGCLRNRGVAYDQLKNYTASIDNYTELLKLVPTSDFAYNRRAIAYRALGKQDLAIADLEASLKIKPDSQPVKDLLFEIKKLVVLEKNRDELKKELDDSAEAVYSLGLTAFNEKRFDAAIGYFSTCLIGPSVRSRCQMYRGMSFRELKKYDEAISDLTQAIALGPKRQMYTARALSYREKGEHKLAIADMTEAIRLEPKAAEYYVVRAQMYELAADRTAAKADYEAALRLQPANTDAKAALQKLTGKP